MDIRQLKEGDTVALRAFFESVPEGDRTFFKEDVLDPNLADSWINDGRAERFVAVEDGAVVGSVAIIAGVGWSAHVGEVRLVVEPTHRRRGVGRALARAALLRALELGLSKLMVEVVADQHAAIALFEGIGFEPQALLSEHIRDRGGELRDLLVLAHSVSDTWAAMTAAGIDHALR